MELPNIGNQCSLSSCRQLDFLPFTCHGCKLIFCLEHRERDSHSCRVHEEAKDFKEPLNAKSYICSLEDCKAKELVAVVCPACAKNFCMRHRHQPEHACEKFESRQREMPTPVEKVESIIGRELKVRAREPKRGKMSKTAVKVALMKMKMHAIGDKGIPQTEREYFTLKLPENGGRIEEVPMYFCKKWSIGRIIDYICDLKGIVNKNNIQGEKKLRLLHNDVTLLDPCRTLEELINNGSVDLEVRSLKLSHS